MFADRPASGARRGGGDGSVSFRREAHVPRAAPTAATAAGATWCSSWPTPRAATWPSCATPAPARQARSPRGGLRRRAEPGASRCGCRPGPRWRIPSAACAGTWCGRPARGRSRAGGWGPGQHHFASSTRQAPRFAERGLPGEEGWLDLRLRLLADAGLVGLPNAGKSSLLARLTRAQPQVADYPFTTLEPVLGTLEADDRQLVVADIPGLIEGASGGAGLGHEFLAHVERTRLLVHVLDLAPLDGSDPVENHLTVEGELEDHGAGLAELPRIVCLSKADLVPEERIEAASRSGASTRPERLSKCSPPRRPPAAGSTSCRRPAAPRPAEEPLGVPTAEEGEEVPASTGSTARWRRGSRCERAGEGTFRVAVRGSSD